MFQPSFTYNRVIYRMIIYITAKHENEFKDAKERIEELEGK